MKITALTGLLAAVIIVLPLAKTLAQNSTNNPNHQAGTEGSQLAHPQRPGGTSNPALTTQTLPASQNATVPPDKNPNVTGATGHTIVRGNNSTLSGDKNKTVGQRTSGTSE